MPTSAEIIEASLAHTPETMHKVSDGLGDADYRWLTLCGLVVSGRNGTPTHLAFWAECRPICPYCQRLEALGPLGSTEATDTKVTPP